MAEGVGSVALVGCQVDALRHRVIRDDGGEVVLSALEARLFGYLAARAGQDVTRDELLAAVWGHVAAVATRAVDHSVARLRTKIGEPSTPRHLLTVHGVGYRLVLPVADARVAPPPPELPPVALGAGVFDRARRRFVPPHGEPVALSKLEADLLDVLLAAPGQIVAREALIAAVWGRGRHDASLDALVGRLRRRIGDPDGAVLATVRGVGLRLERSAPKIALPPAPLPSTPFEDRPERAAVTQALAETAIVTLRGVAGVGKTRLALEVARADAAHVVWVDLAPRGARSGIAHAALAALGSLASATGDAEVDVGLALARAPAGTWVILDNFEHLVACAGIVDVWSAKAPSVRFLVTSREALGLPTEAIVDLAPLPHASACRLFTHRADVGGVAADDPAVGALVDHLDRLPLALELAAARVGELGVGELSERIAARLDLLVRRPPGSVSQHSTLRGAFDTSWDLLSPVERQVFARCSVFAATFDAEALRVVVGAAFPLDRSAEETPAVDRAIDGLVRRSFLQRDGGELRMLDSLRAYGREKLALLGVENEAWAAHRAFVLGRARAAAAVQITPAELVKVRALRPDLEQVWARAVAPDDRAVAALGLSRILGEEGPFDQRLDLLRAAALDDARPELRWRLWRELSNAERNLGVEGFGQASAQRSLAIVEGLPPGTERDQGRVMAWLALAGALGRQGAFAEARARYEAAWRLADQTGVVGAGRAAHGLAEVAFYDGEPYSVVREACARAERSLPRTNSLMRGYLLDFWGMVAADAGAFAEADGLFQDAVVDAASGSAGLDVNVRWRRSWRLRWRGRDAEAEALLAELAADPSVAPPVRILVPVERSLWALAAGQLDAASDHVDQALAMSALPAYSAMFARFHRGRVDHAMGRFADAEARYAAAVRGETPVSARISRVFHAMALADLDRPQLAREPLGIVAADVAERGSVALRALVAVAEAVVQVAEARAGQVPWATAEAAVDAAFAAAGVTLPGGFVLGRCHLDLVVATCLLRRTLARTAERPASG